MKPAETVSSTTNSGKTEKKQVKKEERSHKKEKHHKKHKKTVSREADSSAHTPASKSNSSENILTASASSPIAAGNSNLVPENHALQVRFFRSFGRNYRLT
jgi:hypothetical protein